MATHTPEKSKTTIWACRRKKNAASGFPLQSFFIFFGIQTPPKPEKK
jgi:hypothetical protein